MMDPEKMLGTAVVLVFAAILADAFFLGLFIVDDAVIPQLIEETYSMVP